MISTCTFVTFASIAVIPMPVALKIAKIGTCKQEHRAMLDDRFSHSITPAYLPVFKPAQENQRERILHLPGPDCEEMLWSGSGENANAASAHIRSDRDWMDCSKPKRKA